ncbi:MAG: DEAD/DEAH box helicase [Clostridiales bacterium]|nr:DEAD/DEAH box helicase [Clostridiales bacterium]
MLQLSRLGIRNLASSDLVYSQGLKDFKDNKVVNATWSKGKKQYRIIVKDNFKFQVVIQTLEDGKFDHYCNCAEHLEKKGACRHVVTALFFVLNYQEKTLMEEPDNPEDKAVFQIIEYFSNRSLVLPKGETFTIEVTLTVPELLDDSNRYAYATFRVGSSQLYKVQSIKKFINDYYDEKTITLGKNFKFIPGISKFDKKSRKIINFLTQIYEIQKVSNVKFHNDIFNKDQVILSPHLLLRFLNIVGEDTFTLEMYGNTYEDVTYIEQNPDIEYLISIEDDAIRMDYSGAHNVIPLMQTGELLYMDHVIYHPNKRFIRNYAPFYNHLGDSKNPLYFKEANRDKFLELILPVINETFKIAIPDEIKDRFITDDLEPIVYLDLVRSKVVAKLNFKYGDIEFNSFLLPPNDEYIILRQALEEDSYIELLESYGFQPDESRYVLDNNDKIYSFLSDHVHELAKKCQVFYTDAFKNMRISTPSSVSAGVSLSSDLNLLELDLEFEGIPKEELKEIYRAYQVKKKYYRLDDNSFINLEDNVFKEVWNVLSNLNVSYDDLDDEVIKLPNSQALYLEHAFEGNGINLRKNQDFTELVNTILNPQVRDYSIPKDINARLRNYQITGYKWLRTLADYNLGGILADDMGLGKTLQSIVYIKSIKDLDKSAKFLVVCPSSLVYNWQDELETFAPDLTSTIIIGTPEERESIINNDLSTDVWITSYPLIRRDIHLYQDIDFNTIFIDEAQNIKNPNSLNSKSVKLIKAKHRFAITGTPIENSLTELWSIFDFIMPNYLSSHSKFTKEIEKPILRGDKEALEELNRRTAPFILRRMKKDVLTELPDKIEEKKVSDMTEEQRKVYLSYLASIKSEIDQEIESKGFERSKIMILSALTRLRQICCHPATFLDNYEGGSGKLMMLMDILEEALANGHRILLFSQFTSMLSIIKDSLDEANISYFYLDGSTKAKERTDNVKRFNEGEGDVFLISLKAGGTGLNLTGADTVIHFDPWWNPAVEDQATDRAHRMGQEKTVHVMKMITKGTIEEKIFKLQQKKKDLSDAVIHSKEIFVNSLTRQELEDIFS